MISWTHARRLLSPGLSRRGQGARGRLAALALALLACSCEGGEATFVGHPAPVAVDSCASSKTHAALLTSLVFARETSPGVTEGFDLDNEVSQGTEDASCRHKDFVDPEGRQGIDNQLAALIPVVESVVGNAVDGLLQGSINDGQLLLMLEMDHSENMTSDPCVDLAVQIARGKPSLGTDGVVEAYQTFELDPNAPRGVGRAAIENGVLTAGPMEIAIPLKIFDVSFTLHVHGARFRYTIDDEGQISGVFGGGIVVDELLAGVSQGAGVDRIIGGIRLALNASADLAPDADGKCRQLSATIHFTATPAFVRR
jgi:hypothetical protein